MTMIEQGYVEQGYQLPAGWDWQRVAAARAEYRIEAIYVPVALGTGVAAWGVPMRDGQFLTHSREG